ncbi:MAG: hypothetical protein A3F11_07065 [Gammaproteobacteria bacterium RIFCSPHIGHO2_12_FULL_37_14]|nr:MAG: hypothetical protein A3F11_07065 [Gammaproteobacteria bacterium RIFCSPHIGHO2_12_FULL_37_14]
MKNSFFIEHKLIAVFMLISYSILTFGYFTVANANSIQAYGVSSSPFVNTGNVMPCYLDIASSDINKINSDIQNQQNINVDSLKTKYTDQFKAISQSTICQFQAKETGIKQLPAIIFNNRYVIYGVHNIQRAKLLFESYQEENNQ